MNWMLRFPSTENSSGWKPNRPAEAIDYGKYAALCEKLKVTSDRLLLVNSDLSVEECEGVSYFWNYRVANCATITGNWKIWLPNKLKLPEKPFQVQTEQ